MTNWKPYNNGQSIGTAGPEGDKILRDEIRAVVARVTIKQSPNYISVTCSIPGWIEHTRFFKEIEDAQRDYDQMKEELGKIVNVITSTNDPLKIWEMISSFVRKFEQAL
jgi:hypothetical protein